MMTKNKYGTRERQEGKKAHNQEGHRANLVSNIEKEAKEKGNEMFLRTKD